MPAFTPLALVASLCSSLLAVAPLGLHVGSTREWVKHVGASPDSVRYRLEFLDSTSRDSSGTDDSTVDWRVRITRSGSASVADTAVLRVVGSQWNLRSDSLPTEERRRFRGAAFWLKPSRHFPIDLQYHAPDAFANLSSPLRNDLITGLWEVVLARYADADIGMLVSFDRRGDQICNNSLSNGFCHSAPAVASIDGIGIVAWLNYDAYWELRSIDGIPLAPSPGSFGHTLRKGECWVYRDSSEYAYFNQRSRSRAFVTLELLAAPSDSDGWVRLPVRKSVHPDTGTPSDTTYTVLVDTLHSTVRIGERETTPWNPGGSFENWALGLLKHPLFPDSSKASYSTSSSSFDGEDVTYRSGSTHSFRMLLDNRIGTTSISSSSSKQGIGLDVGFGYRTWTLVAHSLDNTSLAALPMPSRPVRDLAWLHTRIAQDPTLEVVRIRLDGARTSARGPAAVKLLQERGVGIVQVRDGRELTTLRIARP